MTQAIEKENGSGPVQKAARMPALFVGHGNPLNAIEDNEFSRVWTEVGRSLPRPEVVLVISAHWETDGSWVTAMQQPRTIHDFRGFPQPLYQMQYPAPGMPEMVDRLKRVVRTATVKPDSQWGLDHGSWSVLCRMFPDARIPVVQLSLDYTRPAAFHYELGGQLKELRNDGVLIVGSGNMVHNLGVMVWQGTAFDWAVEMDQMLTQLILSGDHRRLIDYDQMGAAAPRAVPTSEHYLPLLYILALQDEEDDVKFFADKVTLGSVSMRSLRIG